MDWELHCHGILLISWAKGIKNNISALRHLDDWLFWTDNLE